jgi:nitronate monooxygenase
MQHALGVLWQGLRDDPGSAAQTVMAANAPMLLQRSMTDGKPAEGVMSAGQVAALIGRLDSCEQVISGIVAQACERHVALSAMVTPSTRLLADLKQVA